MGIDIEPYDIVGLAGAAIFVAAYFANQQRWLRSEDWRYPFANLIGAVLILVSLVFEWNFPSVVIEVFWAIISIYGMAKSLRERAQEWLDKVRAGLGELLRALAFEGKSQGLLAVGLLGGTKD